MKEQGLQPNIVSYASLARPSAHNGDWQEVERLAAEMAAAGLSMNDYFLHTLLTAYAAARPRQSLRAEAAFRRAASMGVQANKHVVSALARAVGRARASELVQETPIRPPPVA